ncbi:hypothetical protein ACWKSP_28835 [Micromonosporaceae bacterium Da 78-11]
MRVIKFAAGLAVGYVLGSRAGREKYEQIATGFRQLSGHPTVVQAQEKVKDAISTGVDTAAAKLTPAEPAATPKPAEPAAKPTPVEPAAKPTPVEPAATLTEPIGELIEPSSELTQPINPATVATRRRTKSTTTSPSVTSDLPA